MVKREAADCYEEGWKLEEKGGYMVMKRGEATVALVGAGPGDPGLITVKGRQWIRKADVIIYDRLVNPALLEAAPVNAEMIFVGKTAGAHTLPQEAINRLIVAKAQEGKRVVRLKGGDPFIFGRGGEELEELVAAGVTFEVVPGITSAIAVPAYAGIPLTHREYSSTVTFITGHENLTKASSTIPWRALAGIRGTLVFLMGVGNLCSIVDHLIAAGHSSETPAAVIQRGTYSDQRTVEGCLQNIVQRVADAQIASPAVLVVGEVAGLRKQLQWYEQKPLFGKQILITRACEQAGELRVRLEELGAGVYECPTIAFEPADDIAALDRSVERVGLYQWLIFTSVNGVERWFQRLLSLGKDVRALAGVRIAVIGPATAERLQCYGLRADYQPKSFVAEELAAGLMQITDLRGGKVLLARAAEARNVLPELLRGAGAEVDEVAVYRTVKGQGRKDLHSLLTNDTIDVVTFTSSSTVQLFAKLIQPASLGEVLQDRSVVCIGPITAATVEELGGHVDAIAHEYTMEGMVECIITEVVRREQDTIQTSI